MSDVTVSVESRLPEAKEELAKALALWAEMTGGEMVNLTHRDKNNRGTPVDTGRLRNSMTFAKSADNKTVYVGTNVEYARPVEEGRQGKGGAHMLRNAVMDVKDTAQKYLEDALKSQDIV